MRVVQEAKASPDGVDTTALYARLGGCRGT
jgi:hypothetical protein